MLDADLRAHCTLIQHFADDYARRGVGFLVVGLYALAEQRHLSATEATLLNLRLSTFGFTDRIAWLQSGPAHFDALYGDLAAYSPDYVRQIFHPVPNVASRRGRINQDHRSEHVNVACGYRLTTGQPETYDNAVFVVGNSSTYGFGCEDRHTLPSQLQACLNAQAGPRDRRRAVFNLGARGMLPYVNFHTLSTLACRPGDVVVLQGMPSEVIHALRAMPERQIATLIPDFSGRHAIGEIFIDRAHVNHRGQALVARQIAAALRSLPSPAPSSHTEPAERPTLDAQALAAYREACRPFLEQATALDRHPGLQAWLRQLSAQRRPGDRCGALVVNANPYTLGHRHLVEHAAARVDHLYVFVVEEDRSTFTFAERHAMVQAGTAHLDNVTVLPSGRFMMSALTCPAYFTKEMRNDVALDASQDLGIFGECVAPLLGIQRRFVAEEPHCAITRQHNRQMRNLLPVYGVRVDEIPRLRIDGEAISASRVRRALDDGRWQDLRRWVPDTTAALLVARHAHLQQAAA